MSIDEFLSSKMQRKPSRVGGSDSRNSNQPTVLAWCTAGTSLSFFHDLFLSILQTLQVVSCCWDVRIAAKIGRKGNDWGLSGKDPWCRLAIAKAIAGTFPSMSLMSMMHFVLDEPSSQSLRFARPILCLSWCNLFIAGILLDLSSKMFSYYLKFRALYPTYTNIGLPR